MFSSIRISLQSVSNIKYGSISFGGQRTLYSESYLGIYGLLKRREHVVKTRRPNTKDETKTRLRSFINQSDGQKNIQIFRNEVIDYLHLMQNNVDDISTLREILQRHDEWQPTGDEKIDQYTLGPVILRTLNYFNADDAALAIYNDHKLNGLFQQNVSFLLLLHLLYKNGRFFDLLNSYKEISSSCSERGIHLKADVVTLAFAACYKLSTAESMNYATLLMSEQKSKGVPITRKILTFYAGQALQSNEPQVALDTLSLLSTHSHVTVRSIKVLALAQLGRYEEVLTVLRSAISEIIDEEVAAKYSYVDDVINKLRALLAGAGPDILNRFEETEKILRNKGHINSVKTLGDLLCADVLYVPKKIHPNRDLVNVGFQTNQHGGNIRF